MAADRPPHAAPPPPGGAIRRAVVIAAGLGERLRAAGIDAPKPLVEVAGKPLLAHVLGSAAAAGIEHVTCLFNERDDAAEAYCRRTTLPVAVDVVRRSTASSMESLFTVAAHAGNERFLCLTVDAVFAPESLRRFVDRAAEMPGADAVLAVTCFVDDEKPLFVRFGEDGRVTALGPAAAASGWVTAGFYVFHPRVFAEADAARAAGCGALRDFLAWLLRRGRDLRAVPVGKTVDVDRPGDIAAAERFVKSGYRE